MPKYTVQLEKTGPGTHQRVIYAPEGLEVRRMPETSERGAQQLCDLLNGALERGIKHGRSDMENALAGRIARAMNAHHGAKQFLLERGCDVGDNWTIKEVRDAVV